MLRWACRLAHALPALPLLKLIYSRQLSLPGTRGISVPGFHNLLEIVETGQLRIDKLVTERIALSGMRAALSAMDGVQPLGVTMVTDFTH